MAEPRTPIEQIERMRNLLAFLLVGAFVGTIPLFVFKTVTPESKEIIVYMVGQLSGMATTALGFYFVNKVGQDALEAKRNENSTKMIETVKSAVETLGTGDGGKAPDASEPQKVEVVNTSESPVPTTTQAEEPKP